MKQEQFLNVVTAEEAHRIFWEAVRPAPLGTEIVPIGEALGRVLAADVVSAIDVPYFDRSNVDGYAVRAQDTYGANETEPVFLKLTDEVIHTNVVPRIEVTEGMATPIATGGVIPRGVDAVVMVEQTIPRDGGINVVKAVVPGGALSFAGTDIGAGETVLHRRVRLTSRETGVLAAIGQKEVPVFRRPRVAVLSTGDEIISPGDAMEVGKIYDSNGTIISDALRELGCEPVRLGIVKDNVERLREKLTEALKYDFVLLSGGTSKGAGDLNYTVVGELGEPGILVHGVALKPGKPLCLAAIGKTPLAILPGFPTSAVFTFHEFVAPVLRVMAGRGEERRETIAAELPMRMNSEKGRTEFLLVNLVNGEKGYAAYPMGKGSGSVTAFSKADGFITIDRNSEFLEASEPVEVTLIGQSLAPADLVLIGSHCVGADYLLSLMSEAGWRVKFITVGSQGGLAAAQRLECDVAGMHLLDEKTGVYNRPFLDEGLELVKGYGRKQGMLFRPDDARFAGKSLEEAIATALAENDCLMINRNRGSGTRVLIDSLLKGKTPPGFFVEAKSHNAVAAAIKQGRMDWGVAIENVARPLGLGFLPIVDEEYDFVVPTRRRARPPVQAFLELLRRPETREGLRKLGMTVGENP
ncbi:MAG: molybdopterin biosynthesis protein [SAR324 cluster bacterium]|nr:molybdopterin biosynthesis protein [SAR324 cluster bacterium]